MRARRRWVPATLVLVAANLALFAWRRWAFLRLQAERRAIQDEIREVALLMRANDISAQRHRGEEAQGLS